MPYSIKIPFLAINTNTSCVFDPLEWVVTSGSASIDSTGITLTNGASVGRTEWVNDSTNPYEMSNPGTLLKITYEVAGLSVFDSNVIYLTINTPNYVASVSDMQIQTDITIGTIYVLLDGSAINEGPVTMSLTQPGAEFNFKITNVEYCEAVFPTSDCTFDPLHWLNHPEWYDSNVTISIDSTGITMSGFDPDGDGGDGGNGVAHLAAWTQSNFMINPYEGVGVIGPYIKFTYEATVNSGAAIPKIYLESGSNDFWGWYGWRGNDDFDAYFALPAVSGTVVAKMFNGDNDPLTTEQDQGPAYLYEYAPDSNTGSGDFAIKITNIEYCSVAPLTTACTFDIDLWKAGTGGVEVDETGISFSGEYGSSMVAGIPYNYNLYQGIGENGQFVKLTYEFINLDEGAEPGIDIDVYSENYSGCLGCGEGYYTLPSYPTGEMYIELNGSGENEGPNAIRVNGFEGGEFDSDFTFKITNIEYCSVSVPPSAPEGSTENLYGRFVLSWSASEGSNPISSYNIYDYYTNAIVDSTTDTSYTATLTLPDYSEHAYYVTAVDDQSNESLPSGYLGGNQHIWYGQNAASSGDWRAVAWSPELGLFAAVASDSTGVNNVMTSPDGENWTLINTGNPDGWKSICWAAELGLFVAVSTWDNNRVMTSSDGITWTTRTSAGGSNPSWYGVCWAPEINLFVAVANGGTQRVMTSPDGINWTGRTVTANSWLAVCWSPELNLFVAVANGGTNRVMTSPDGITWTDRSVTQNDWRSVCWSSELGMFVAVGASGTNRIMTSTNGISWTDRSTTTSSAWDSVCWSSELGVFVAVAISTSDSRFSAWSTDGITWTREYDNQPNKPWDNVCWSPELGMFCAVGSGASTGTNKVMISSAGRII